MTCTCTMAQKLVGDGCYKCNPAIHIDHMNDELDDVRQQRDELLEAAKNLIDIKGRFHTETGFPSAIAMNHLIDVVKKFESER